MNKDLVVRGVTGVIFVCVIIGSILWSQYAFSLVFALITIIGLWEFYRICEIEKVHAQKTYGMMAGMAIFLLNAVVSMNFIRVEYLFLSLLFLFGTFIRELFRNKKHPFKNIAFTILGIFYIAVPFTLLNYVGNPGLENGYEPGLLLGYFILIWMGDTGAYVVGVTFGRNKLFERISPKKSWEGFIGGAIFSLGFAWLLSLYVKDIDLQDWIVLSVITIITGTLGDLVESLLKRSASVKDSGTIMPGHGGILDRFDSVLISAPFVFAYLILFH